MEQEIKDIIAKHLPQHVGDVLKERLNKADELQGEFDMLKDRFNDAHNTIKHLEKELEKNIKHKHSEEDLLSQWGILEERQRNLEIQILNIKLEESEKRAQIGQHLVETVFKSPVYRKHVENMTLGSYDSMGRYNQTAAAPVNVTERID